MPSPSIRIGARPLLEYIANASRRNRIIKEQIRHYTDPTSQAHVYYGPIITAMKNAVNAADPDAILAKCVQQASPDRGQRTAFQAIADGFTTWHRSTSSTGVRVPFATWTRGELTVTLLSSAGECWTSLDGRKRTHSLTVRSVCGPGRCLTPRCGDMSDIT